MGKSNLVQAAWLLFTLSGVFFLISAYRARDVNAVIGSILWLVGVGLFLKDARS